MDITDLTSLLQPSEEDQRRAMNMGLLSAGLGIMASSRNRGGRLAPALGQGGLLGLQTYNQMTDPTQQMRRVQIAATVGELEEKQKMRAAQQAALQNLPEQYKQAAAMGVPISEIFKRMNPEQKFAYHGGDVFAEHQIDPATGAPTKVGTVSPQVPFEYELGPDGQPRMKQGVFNSKVAIARAGKPDMNTQIVMKQEGEEAKTVGKGFGETYIDLQKGDLAAAGKIARYDRMSQLLDGVSTGKLTPAGTEVAAYAKSIGLSVDPNLGNKQAAEALSNELALQARNPSGGAGMPGALSDSDRRFLAEMTPGISKDNESNKLLIETGKKLAQRDRDVAKLARDYRKKRGQLDEGFYDELASFSEKNPLFAKPTKASILDQADAIIKGR